MGDFMTKSNLFLMGKKYIKEVCLVKGDRSKVHLTSFSLLFSYCYWPLKTEFRSRSRERQSDEKFLPLGSTGVYST